VAGRLSQKESGAYYTPDPDDRRPFRNLDRRQAPHVSRHKDDGRPGRSPPQKAAPEQRRGGARSSRAPSRNLIIQQEMISSVLP
jgi:hypothetical protein